MREEQLQHLITKYLDGACTPEEAALVEGWFDQLRLEPGRQLSDRRLQDASALMRDKVFGRRRGGISHWTGMRLAAACIAGIVVLTGAIYLSVRRGDPPRAVAYIAPGSNKAVLVLGNGQQLVLDSAADGHIATEASNDIIKLRNGQIAYRANDPKKTGATAPAYNSLVVPRGGQYKVVLPDGSNVWINSASVLRYPASFAMMTTREIFLEGEAYFEIAPDKARPFIVKSARQEARVLGTQFNINAYPDNASIRTTLLEGGLAVKSLVHPDSCILKPGRQAVIGNAISIREVDVENVTDWKDGYFIFHEEPLADILSRLSRWYNVEIIFKDDVKKVKLDGIVARNTPLSEVLNLLSRTGKVHFEVRDRVVYATD